MEEKKKFSARKTFFIFLSIMLSFVFLVCGFNILIDPYFHYHAPLGSKGYLLNADQERYINDGILRHYKYDALIIGNSMIQNFKSSEFDEIFGVNSVKTGFSGASFKEIDQNVRVALKHNKELKTIIRCIDDNKLLDDKDRLSYSAYPTYLYDNNIFNDYKYLLNKDVTKESIKVIMRALFENRSNTGFDSYGYWNDSYKNGKEEVLSTYNRPEINGTQTPFTEEDAEIVRGTINQNVIETAKANPDVTFYLFITPYSILYWDALNRYGTLNKQLAAQKLAIELMLECENIKLFSFFDDTELFCNLDNYKDSGHYIASINSYMLKCMKNGEHILAKENYEEYINNLSMFLNAYDYDAIFAE